MRLGFVISISVLVTIAFLPSSSTASVPPAKHYQTLGLPKTAAAADVKRAYRRLAKQWHPDKNPSQKSLAEKKFKEISAAYQVLSDPKKRREYDMQGDLGSGAAQSSQPWQYAQGPQFFQSFNFDSEFPKDGQGAFRFNGGEYGEVDIFGGLFKNIFRGPMGFQKARYQAKEGATVAVERTIRCSLLEAYRGCRKKFIVKDVYLGRAIKREVVVDVKPGWKSGTKVTFPATRAFPVTVVFMLEVLPHPFLRRVGDDLHWTCVLSKKQLGKSLSIKIPMLDGSLLCLNMTSEETATCIGSRKTFPGLGMPAAVTSRNSVHNNGVANATATQNYDYS